MLTKLAVVGVYFILGFRAKRPTRPRCTQCGFILEVLGKGEDSVLKLHLHTTKITLIPWSNAKYFLPEWYAQLPSDHRSSRARLANHPSNLIWE